ncbi:MAG: M24 family metallopeptidase [Planctomycetota bacterium]
MGTALDDKLSRLRTLLDERQAQGLLLTRCSNFAWLTGGGDNHVRNTSDLGASSLLVTPDQAYYLGNNIESPRVQAEEIDGLGFSVREFPWHASNPLVEIADLLGADATLLSDNGAGGSANIESDIAPLRWRLYPDEVETMRAAGRIAGESIQAAARALERGVSEYALAARLCAEVVERGGFPAVSMVAADERIERYRHPIATDARIARRAMLVLCVRLRGLIASCTRLVELGSISDEIRRRHRAVCTVDATFHQTCRAGASAGAVFRAGREAYAATGFAEEWKLHHQGGATGYETRDYLGNDACPHTVLDPQAFAWNPSITGTKSEGTIIAWSDRHEVVTEPGDWPTITVEGPAGPVDRPDILEH